MQPAEHFRKKKKSKTFISPGLSEVHKKKTHKELRYGKIKIMRTVKSTNKILNNITSKWLKFYFHWEINYSLGSLNLLLYFQPRTYTLKTLG